MPLCYKWLVLYFHLAIAGQVLSHGKSRLAGG